MNRNPLTSSKVICKALGFEPSGVPAKEEGFCALCGLKIEKEDIHAPLSLGQSFVDDLYLAARGSKVMCGYCVPCLDAVGLRTTGYGAYSLTDGALPFRKWADIAEAIKNPPAPPFVMVYATANNQHMAWRSCVNYSRDLFYVRVGLRDLKIRRKILLDAVNDCVAIGTAIEEERKTPSKRTAAAKTLPHPFANLSNDLKDNDHGRIRPAAFMIAEKNPEIRAALQRVLSLSLGETWALRFLLTPGAGQ